MELEQRARAFPCGAHSCGCAETGSLCVFFCAQLCVHPERGLSFTGGWSQPQKSWWAELLSSGSPLVVLLAAWCSGDVTMTFILLEGRA